MKHTVTLQNDTIVIQIQNKNIKKIKDKISKIEWKQFQNIN